MTHEYKVGDLVRILPRDGHSSDYMYGFTEEMLYLVGHVYKIIYIFQCDHDGSSKKKHDDGNKYLLEGNAFTWASSMFEPYDENKIDSPKFKEGDIVEVLPIEGKPTDYSHAYVSYMLEYAGKRATIVRVRKDSFSREGRRGDDGYCYTLDIDKGNWDWSSSALKAVSSREPDKKNMDPAEVTLAKSDQPKRPECPYPLIRESQENYNLNFNV